MEVDFERIKNMLFEKNKMKILIDRKKYYVIHFQNLKDEKHSKKASFVFRKMDFFSPVS
jgi:hypothetical protein